MNYATRFYNAMKVSGDDLELFELVVKEFTHVIKNSAQSLSKNFSVHLFNDDSAVIIINKTMFITSDENEFLECVVFIAKENPQLKEEIIECLDKSN